MKKLILVFFIACLGWAKAEYQGNEVSLSKHEVALEWFQDAKLGIYFDHACPRKDSGDEPRHPETSGWAACKNSGDHVAGRDHRAGRNGRNRTGEIAWLYFCRWRIEKTFDTFENDLEENKARATGNNAQIQQACFIAMAGNFLRYIKQMLDRRHGLTDEKVVRKYRQQLDKRKGIAKKNGRNISPFLDAGRHMVKLSLQYIRCFRTHFFGKSLPKTYLPAFGKALRAYL